MDSLGTSASPRTGSLPRVFPYDLDLYTERALVVGLMLVGLVAHGVNAFGYPTFSSFADEGTYTSNAWALIAKGQLSPYTYTWGHAPAGWMLLALWMVLTGGVQAFGLAIDSGRILMVLLHVAMVPLLYHVVRRLGGAVPAAALAAFIFSVSPLAITYQRMVLLDNIMMFWTLLSIGLLLRSEGRLSAFVLSGLSFGVAVLSKETDLFLIPAVVLLVALYRRPHQGKFPLVLWVFLMGVVVSWYPLYAIIKGEFLPAQATYHLLGQTLHVATGKHVSLMDSAAFQVARSGAGNLLDATSQFWLNVNTFWLPLDAFLLVGGWAAALGNLLRGVRNRQALAAGLLALLPLYYLGRGGNVFKFYIIIAIPFLCLNLGVLVSPLFRRLPTRASAGLAVVAAAGLLFYYYGTSGSFALVYQSDQNLASLQAVEAVKATLPSQSLIVSDDSFYTDLHDPSFGGPAFPNVHNHWQVGSDPTIHDGVLRGDWHNVDYLLMTPDMWTQFAATNNTLALEALENSVLVKQWQSDGTSIELRKVDKTGASYDPNILKTTH